MSLEDPDLQQQKETTLMALFQAISVSLLVLERDFTIWMMNASAAAWLEKNPQDLKGQPLWKFLSPEEFLTIDRHLQQVLQTKQTVFFRGTHQQREYGHTFFPILDASGSVVYLALTGRDISEHVQLERDLWEGRQALQNALDGTRAGLWDWHIPSGAVSFNERWAEIAGYTLEELQPVDIQTWIRLCHPDDLQKSDQLLQRLFRHEEEHYHCNCRIRHKNGEWVWVTDSGKIVEWSEDGKPLRMIGTHIDITEEKRRENALFFRSSILDQISDMVATTDLSGNITYINQALIDYAGCSATALVGQPFERLTTGFTNPPSREQILTQTLEKSKWQSELVRSDSAGKSKILECNTQILHDAQGNPSGICCIMKDVSERKQAEEELHRKTNELDLYFTSSLDLLCIADNDGYFRRLNPEWERTLGYSLSELVGRSFFSLIHPEDLETTYAAVNRLKQQNPVLSFENRYRTKDGDYRWIEWRSFPAGNAIYAVARDITVRKAVEESLRNRQQQFYSLFHNMQEGVALHEVILGDDGQIVNYRIIEVNPKYEQILGIPAANITGKLATEVYGVQAPPYLKEFSDVALSGVPSQLEVYFQPLEKHFSISIAPWGKNGFATIFSDVSERVRNERALRESEERFRRIAENSPDVIFRMSLADGRYHYVSPAAEKVLGYSAEEIYAEPLLVARVIHPSWRDYFRREWANLLAGKVPLFYEFQIMDKSGAGRWLFQRNQLILDEEGKPAFLEGSITDITERKQAEEALEQSAQQLKDLVEYAPFGVLLTEGPEQTVRMMNSTFTGILGYTLAEVPDVTHWWPLAYPEEGYRGRMKTEWTEGIRKSYAIHTTFWVRDANVTCKDGTIRSMDICMANLDSFQVIFFLDRTAYKLAEDRLRQSEHRFRTYINEAPDGVFILDGEGLCQEANPSLCNMLGYTYQEMKSMSLGDICIEKHATKGQEFLEQLRNANRRNDELVFTRKDGRKIDVWIDAVKLPNGHLMAFCHDITERKHLEERLQEAQKMEAIGRLAGGIAHDFNNLLQVINGNADMAMQELLPDNPAYGLMEEVHKAGMRAAKLVGQLLAFSRRQVIRPDLLHLNDVISGLLKMLNRILGEHIQIEFHADPALGTILADRIQMEQILLNLCANARDAMPEGGLLTMETCNITMDSDFCTLHKWAKIGSYVFLRIADNGCGMNTDTLEHLWEPFFTTKDISKGTGLGLATVYGVVRQHEGIINVYSELGKGTEFKIYFPRAEVLSCEKEIPASILPESGTETILVAEDEDMVRNLTRRILENAGYTVWTAGNGQDAVTLCDSLGDKIDLALLDVVMPGMGGRAVYERLKVKFPRMRFLFASGYNVNAIHTNFVLEEGFELIEKPFSRQQLLSIVRRILDS